MRRRILNKLASYNAVLAYLKKNKTVTDLVPAFDAAILKLEELINQITQKSKVADTATSGKYKDKFDAADALVMFLLPLVHALKIFGHKAHKNDIIAIGSLTETALSDLNDIELVKKAEEILDMLTANLAALSDYRVTQDSVTGLTGKIAALNTTLLDAHSSTSEKSGAGESVIELVDQVDTLFEEEMDSLAAIIKNDHREFFKGYKTARTIHDVGGSRGGNDETPPENPPDNK